MFHTGAGSSRKMNLKITCNFILDDLVQAIVGQGRWMGHGSLHLDTV